MASPYARGAEPASDGDAAAGLADLAAAFAARRATAEPAVAPTLPSEMTAGLSRPIFCIVTDRSRLSPATDSELSVWPVTLPRLA